MLLGSRAVKMPLTGSLFACIFLPHLLHFTTHQLDAIPHAVAVVSFNPEPAATVAPLATPSPLAPG